MKEVKLTRNELYDLVWSESMLSLSKKYAISDVGMRKKCKSLEIPVPNAGYWAKLKFGKKVIEKKPLGSFKGDQTVVLFLREADDEKSESGRKDHDSLMNEIENDKNVNLVVPERLVNPDNLIEAVKDDLYKRKLWNNSEDVAYSSENHIDIRVNPANIPRALRIMDTLIKAFKARGHTIKIEGQNSWLVIDDERISFGLRERLKRDLEKEKNYDWAKKIPSGLLVFRIDESYRAKEWVDGKKRLEEQLSAIISFLELRAKKMKEVRIELEKSRAEQEERELIAKELQERKDKELIKFKEIFRLSRRLDRAENIRKYADRLEKYALACGGMTDDVQKNLEWIRNKADWYDPFIEAEDKLMVDVDRNKLTNKKRNWWY